MSPEDRNPYRNPIADIYAQQVVMARYLRILSRDPLRSRYVIPKMDLFDALVSALPLPIRCGA